MDDLEQASRAERAGDHAAALTYLQRAHHDHPAARRAHARIHWRTAAFYARRRQPIAALSQLSLMIFAAIFA